MMPDYYFSNDVGL